MPALTGGRGRTIGHAACFSFYPGKNLGAFGDAGAIISTDVEAIHEMKRLRDHGRTSKYEHEIMAMNSRLDGLQAAILDVKLSHLPKWTSARRSLAEVYQTRLGDQLVPWTDGAVHHLLVMRHDARDKLQTVLREQGIGSGVHYPVPLSKQPAMKPWAVVCPASEVAADTVLSLPMDPLMTSVEVGAVCDAVQGHANNSSA